MKIRKIIAVLCLIVMVCGLLSACGNTKTSNEINGTEVQTQNTENTVQTENVETNIYVEKDCYFVVKDINKADKTLVDGEILGRVGDIVNTNISLVDSIPIYNAQKSKVGYTKANVECYYESAMGEWSYIIFDDGGFFVLTEELLAVAEGLEKDETNNAINDEEESTFPKEEPIYTVREMDKTMYAKQSVNLRSGPSTDYEKVGSLNTNDEVTVTGQADNGWYRIEYSCGVAFVSNNYLSDTKVEVAPPDNGDDTNEDENNSEEEYIPPTDDDTEDEWEDIIEPEEPKYTVDEVIAIYRSTLENGGMMWYPDVYPDSEYGPTYMSWGMDWVPMDDPQTYAESVLRGFQYQGFDVYYIEFQYVENNKVVLKTYFSFIPK